jgi:hypothetical protein
MKVLRSQVMEVTPFSDLLIIDIPLVVEIAVVMEVTLVILRLLLSEVKLLIGASDPSGNLCPDIVLVFEVILMLFWCLRSF